MGPERKGALLLLAGALAIVALVVAAWIYSAALGRGEFPEGGCSLLLVSALMIAAFVGGAIWLFRAGRD